MIIRRLLKSVVIGAGVVIFAIGLVLAQTPPNSAPPDPAPATPAPQAAPASPPVAAPPTAASPAETASPRGGWMGRESRREAQRACRAEFRDQRLTEDERREAIRACVAGRDPREAWRLCREEIRNQRLTEDERFNMIRDCVGKRDPVFARDIGCQKQASERELKRGTRAFGEFMRECMSRP
jgi:hypothetical protein